MLISISLQAQEYYYNGSKKIEIYQSDESFILFEEPIQSIQNHFEKTEIYSKKGFTILKKRKNSFSMKNILGKQSTQISPAFKLDKNEEFEIFPTKSIRVKLLKNKSQNDLSKILTEYSISKIEEKFGIIRIHIPVVHLNNANFQIVNISIKDKFIDVLNNS